MTDSRFPASLATDSKLLPTPDEIGFTPRKQPRREPGSRLADGPTTHPPPIRKVLLELLVAAVVFMSLEALTFRTSLYPSILQPKSYAGRGSFLVEILQEHWPAPDKNAVLVVGNSRIGEGFSSRFADEAADPLRFINASNAGTNLRVWYYLLRRLDPQAGRFGAIVIPLETYNDVGRDPTTTALLNISSILPHIRYADASSFASSFKEAPVRLRAFFVTIFKGYGYQKDFQEFLREPFTRLSQVKIFKRTRYTSAYNYKGSPKSIAGTSYDELQDQIIYPPDSHLTPKMQWRLEYFCRGKQLPYDNREFNQLWIGRIAKHYRRSTTRLIFIRLPRAPLILFDPQPVQPDSFVRTLTGQENVTLLPEAVFNDLERPEYYYDALHMNRAGREIFSQRLAEHVRTELVPNKPSN